MKNGSGPLFFRGAGTEVCQQRAPERCCRRKSLVFASWLECAQSEVPECVCVWGGGGGPLVQGSQHLPHAAPTLHSGQDHPTADVARTPCWVPPHLVLLQQSSCSLLRRAPFLHTPEGRFPPNDHQVAPLMCGESGSQSVMGVGAPPRELSLGQMG